MTVVHQARHFGIDLLCRAILSNHIHLVLRSRPDVVAEWGDSEVARRWLMLCPVRRDKNRQRIEPTEFELNHICHDKEKVAVVRNRLSDISRWMRSQVQDDAVVLSSQSARHLSPVDLSGRDVKSGRGGERGHAVITKGTVAATKVFCRCRLPII